MPEYPPNQSLREARGRYFETNGFGDSGGYELAWVPLAFGPLRFSIPNSAGRVRAVRYHDLHHVVTGYETDWVGEAEIGAWEVASSCRDLFAAWLLNLYAMQVGLWIAPRRVWRAFQRGRHSRNLYGEPFRDALLEESVGELRRRLAVDTEAPAAGVGDGLAFLAWTSVAIALALTTGIVLFAPLILLVAWLA